MLSNVMVKKEITNYYQTSHSPIEKVHPIGI